MTGLHLAQYRIDAELGRGGMGIVYRATDTKLDRTVALKVLPAAALASDDDRARFLREAKAAAQLSHPNVCHVYQVDEAMPLDADGNRVTGQDDARLFIAMEYIEGQTLAARIAGGPLKLVDAVNVAIQVAEALKAAHAKDIVHRDIKSANVMLTSDGVAKVLDFGLAKTQASTMLTRQGSTLGTVAYMSPEQARGQEVDGRSDLYSLGTMLYEMVAGRLPFAGDYEQAVVYGILNEDPEPLTAVRTGVPMGLEWIVNKLLAKAPAERYQGATDLLVDLRTVDLTSSSMSRSSQSRITSAIGPAPARGRSPVVRAGWFTLAGLALLAAGAWLGRTSVPTVRDDASVKRFELFTFETGRRSPWSSWPADVSVLSADGSEVVFRIGDRLWIRSLESLQVEALPGTDGAWGTPSWSQTSRYVWFGRGSGLARIDRQTGISQDVVSTPEDTDDGVLTPDGPYVSIRSRIYGPLTGAGALTGRTDSIPGLGGFNVLSGGRGFLVVTTDSLAEKHVRHVSDEGANELAVLSSQQAVESIDEDGLGTVLMTIRDIGTRRSAIWVLQFDPHTGEVTKPLTVLVSDATAPSLSSGGALLYHTSVPPDSTELVVIDRATGAARRIGDPLTYMTAPSISPDGRRIAARVDMAATADTWIFDVARNTQGRLTRDIENTWRGGWSPDGRLLAFQSRVQAERYQGDIYIQATDGLSDARLLKGGPDNDWYPVVTPDGRSVIYSHNTVSIPETSFEIVPIDGSSSPRPLFDPPYAVGTPSFSDDGRWLVFSANRDDVWNAFIAPWPGLDAVYQVSSGGGSYPVWVGDEIFYEHGGDLWAVAVAGDSPPSLGTPVRVLSGGAVGTELAAPNTVNYAVSRDGRQFVLTRPIGTPAPTRAIYVENWKQLLD